MYKYKGSAGKYHDYIKIEERNIKIVEAWNRGMDITQIMKAFDLRRQNVQYITRNTRIIYAVNIINKIGWGEIISAKEFNRLNPVEKRNIINLLREKGYNDDYIENGLRKKEGWLKNRDRMIPIKKLEWKRKQDKIVERRKLEHGKERRI